MKIVLTHTFFAKQAEHLALKKWGDVPSGLCLLSSYLQKAGLENTVVDPALIGKEEWVSTIKDLEPKYIVLFTNWMTKKAFADAINILKIDACLAGVNFIGIGQDIRNNEVTYLEMGCDVVIPGQIEECLTELINTLDIPMNPFLDHVKGVAYINGRGDLFKTEDRKEFVSFEKFYRPSLGLSWLKEFGGFPLISSASWIRLGCNRSDRSNNPWLIIGESEDSNYDFEQIKMELKACSENDDQRIPLIQYHDSFPEFFEDERTDIVFDFILSNTSSTRFIDKWIELKPRMVWIEMSPSSSEVEMQALIDRLRQIDEDPVTLGLLFTVSNFVQQRRKILALEHTLNWASFEVVKVGVASSQASRSKIDSFDQVIAIDEFFTLVIERDKSLLTNSKWSFSNLKRSFRLNKLRKRIVNLA